MNVSSYKVAVARGFDRAAATYDTYAVIQDRIADRLLQQLMPLLSNPTHVLDLGCGTGRLSRSIIEKCPQAALTALDISPSMLQEVSPVAHRICADFDSLPFAEASFDLIVSGMALQWSQDTAASLQSLYSLLTEGGLCAVTLPVAGTFSQLSACLEKLDTRGHIFPVCEALTAACQRQGWHLKYQETQQKIQYYPTLAQFIRELQLVGANHLSKRHNSLGKSKRYWAMFEAAYEVFRTVNGLPVTYQIGYWILQK